MKQQILFLGLIIISFSATAQTVLLSVDKNNEKISEVGPNLKRHNQVYFRLGIISGSDNPGARIIYGSSIDFAFGFRKRYKISPVYSLGFESELGFINYKFKQTDEKIFPDTIINNISQSLNYSSWGFGVYNRFNFDPHRGNFLGTFFDLGIMGKWDFSITEYSKNKLANGTKEEKAISGLAYVNSLSANVYARLGFSHGSFYTSYRLTDLFMNLYNYPELPRLIFGLELSVF